MYCNLSRPLVQGTLLWCFLLCFIVMTGWAMLMVEIVYPAVQDPFFHGWLVHVFFHAWLERSVGFLVGEIVIQLTCSYTTFIHILYKCWMIM